MSRAENVKDTISVRHLVRLARSEDLEGLYALAAAADAGMTNLPADRDALAARLAASEAALDDVAVREGGAPIYLVLERDGALIGAACVFTRIGVGQPFFSYRVSRLAQVSPDLGKRAELSVLNLVNDLSGHAEVGGLFIAPNARGGQAGRLMARSRYLFIASHRSWFGEHVVADLRGVQDAGGRSPVWNAVGARFYAMSFAEADRTCAVLGTRFIADLGPKYPIYVDLLPPAAREALGRPHRDGLAAERLLIEEGFVSDGYVDIFDGGPTLRAPIDGLRAVREASTAVVARGPVGPAGADRLVAAGQGRAFRVGRGVVAVENSVLQAPDALVDALRLAPGDEVRHVRF